MAFKMKNPSMAKMAKMAGDNRVAMKMKMDSAAKMKKAAPMKKDSRSLLDRAKDEGKQLMAGAKAAGRVLSDKVYFRPKKAVQDAVKAYKKEEDKQAAERKAGSKSPSKMKKSAMKMKEPMKMKKGEPMKLKKKGSAAKFNAKLKAASKAGKLSGKFKEAVDASPVKMKMDPKAVKRASKKISIKEDLKGGREMLAAKKNPGKPKRVGTSIYTDTYQGTGDTRSTRKAERKFAKADKKLAKGKLNQAARKVKKGRKTVVSMPSGSTKRERMK